MDWNIVNRNSLVLSVSLKKVIWMCHVLHLEYENTSKKQE